MLTLRKRVALTLREGIEIVPIRTMQGSIACTIVARNMSNGSGAKSQHQASVICMLKFERYADPHRYTDDVSEILIVANETVAEDRWVTRGPGQEYRAEDVLEDVDAPDARLS